MELRAHKTGFQLEARNFLTRQRQSGFESVLSMDLSVNISILGCKEEIH